MFGCLLLHKKTNTKLSGPKMTTFIYSQFWNLGKAQWRQIISAPRTRVRVAQLGLEHPLARCLRPHGWELHCGCQLEPACSSKWPFHPYGSFASTVWLLGFLRLHTKSKPSQRTNLYVQERISSPLALPLLMSCGRSPESSWEETTQDRNAGGSWQTTKGNTVSLKKFFSQSFMCINSK